MRINNNIMAMNTHRQLGANQMNGAKSMEKLSSGLRINRAGDDAAGLAISEKMRGQIRGLSQASRNAQDGISMIQTAEGALNESHSILQRMRELAVQSATDTNTAADRLELQKEADQLASELTRIGDNTEFNTQKLLNGDLVSAKFHIGANAGQRMDIAINDMRALELGVVGDISATIASNIAVVGGVTPDAQDGTYTVALDGATYQLKDASGTVVATGADGLTFTGTGADNDGSAFGDDAITLTDTAKVGGSVVIAAAAVTSFDAEITNTTLEAGAYTASTTELTDASGTVIATSADATNFLDASGANVFSFGAAITATTQLSVGGIDISNQKSADVAITSLDAAIQSVSAQRSELGAFQNRLEHTINNLGASAENLQAAESRIRDLDMASEMMEFTKTNILNQAATAMLAQANQAPPSVLQLLG